VASARPAPNRPLPSFGARVAIIYLFFFVPLRLCGKNPCLNPSCVLVNTNLLISEISVPVLSQSKESAFKKIREIRVIRG
jgi:hypothetical protein